MARRDEIIAFLDDLLDAGSWEDYGPNGLQVPGAEDVSVVATGVSAHRELFERAREAGAQLVLCHHGLFWRNQPRSISAPVAPTSPITQPEAPTVSCSRFGPEANVITTPIDPIPASKYTKKNLRRPSANSINGASNHKASMFIAR